MIKMVKKILLHTEFVIDSCHHLEGYEGKCKNNHGHSWLVECWFEGTTDQKDEVGILVDFGIVKELKERLDHKDLNVVLGYNPTAENLSEWIYNMLKDKIENDLKKEGIQIKIRLYETYVGKKTYCEYGDF